MKEDKAKLLIAALRSGEYKQADGKLRTKSGFCCLGVACDLYAKEVGGQWRELQEATFAFVDPSASCNIHYLTLAVSEWLGCENSNPRITIGDTTHRPADMNDAGQTFDEIADFIEANWEGLK